MRFDDPLGVPTHILKNTEIKDKRRKIMMMDIRASLLRLVDLKPICISGCLEAKLMMVNKGRPAYWGSV